MNTLIFLFGCLVAIMLLCIPSIEENSKVDENEIEANNE